MAAADKNAISPTRAEDFPEWYQQVVRSGDLAEPSDVRGCMVIKPWGYGLWERMQGALDDMFKETGHQNAYFPLFIPLSYLAKEAEHVDGFAKECAVVTHHRLDIDPETGQLRPAPGAQLTEPLIVRPTSETIIGATYAKWVQSYRDLPILVNQWANVVRWELRPRMFLRTTEFLWQEGHTCHETEAEARAETEQMLRVYETFARDWCALPVIPGEKSPNERFPGAVQTLTIEAMVQDRKAIQAGTSHYLGTNFAKASGITFHGRDNQVHLAHTTSWGMSTRMVGTVLMMHGDDDGAVMPPRISPTQVVILPIARDEATRASVLVACDRLRAELRAQSYGGNPLRVDIDAREVQGGQKTWEWIKKGAPVRVEIGPRDLESGSAVVFQRDRGPKERDTVSLAELVATMPARLEGIQRGLLERARANRDANTIDIDDWDTFKAYFTPPSGSDDNDDETGPTPIHGGFALAHWNGTTEVEERIKADLKVTIRCIPDASNGFDESPGRCILTGEPSARRVVFAKAY
jgi:prolyl-tRNA synthetase